MAHLWSRRSLTRVTTAALRGKPRCHRVPHWVTKLKRSPFPALMVAHHLLLPGKEFAPSLFTKTLLWGYTRDRDGRACSLGRQLGRKRRPTSCIGVGFAPSYSTV